MGASAAGRLPPPTWVATGLPLEPPESAVCDPDGPGDGAVLEAVGVDADEVWPETEAVWPDADVGAEFEAVVTGEPWEAATAG